MLNFRPVARVIGILLVIVGGMMWTGLPFSWYYGSGDGMALFISGLITMTCGLPLWFLRMPKRGAIYKREGYLIVTLGWFAMVAFGTLPYLTSGMISSFPDAFFETVSGMTTTGASILTDIEIQPKGILYWRSLTQWIGGMGIIVLTVAVFPLLGIGGIELFVAEAPGPTSESAKRLWFIYVGLTTFLALLLCLAGMNFYEGINHALTTMATGGFSTRNASMAAFSPTIQYIVIVFMFLAGTNYTILYLAFKRRFGRVWQSDEYKAYLFIVGFFILTVTLKIHQSTDLDWEQSFRDGAFQIVSLITTTGYVTADYTSWAGSLTMLFFILLFVGACAGSTSGGIKIIRHLVFFKNTLLEFKRILHPRAVIPLKLDGQIVRGKIITHIIIFLLVYLSLFLIGSLLLTLMGLDFVTAIGAMATSLGNVGPAIGGVGPVDNFAWLSPQIKLLLSFFMIVGRLELFTVLVLFTPYFWKSN